MAAKVVKLAQPGHDVQTAGDGDLIYNSNWPLLKIVGQGTVKLGSGENDVLIPHNLGYAPMYWIFSNNLLNNWLTGTTPVITLRSEFNAQIGYTVASSEKNFEVTTDASFVGPAQLYYYLFALDLNTVYNAPIINLGKQPQGTPPTNVFKLAKPGKSISSSRLEDYTIHSHARSPMIHAVYPAVAVVNADLAHGQGFVFYHNLGYVPIYFLYRQGTVTGRWFMPNISGLGSEADTQKISISIDGFQGSKFSLVVLKDPFNLDSMVEVTF